MTPDEREEVPAEVLQSPSEVLRDFEACLTEALPGVDVIDRDLGLGTLTADLVGVDAHGRLVLVLLPENAGGSAVMAALDAMSQAREGVALLARHLAEPRIAPNLQPRIVLVAESFEPRTIERLSVFDDSILRLLEVREVRSASAVTTFFVPVGVGAEPHVAEARGLETFLDALDEEQLACTETVVKRLERVGEEVQLTPAPDRLEWRFRGAPLCTLSTVDGRLHSSFPRAAPQPLSAGEDLEIFIEGAIERYVDLLDGHRPEDDLEQIEIVPRDSGPLLTAEELEAFRQ